MAGFVPSADHATYFYSNSNPMNDDMNTDGSWDTPFAHVRPEEQFKESLTAKSGDLNSPMDPFLCYGNLVNDLAGMNSLTLSEGSAQSAYGLQQAVVGLEGQSSLGWGGRPLQQQQSPYKQPQNQQNRGRGRSDEFGGGVSTPPPLAAHRYANNSRSGGGGGGARNNNNNNNTNNNHNNNQHRGGGRNNYNNNRGGPQQHQHRNNNQHSNNTNGNQTNNQINNNGMGTGGGAANNLGYRKLWQQVTCVNRGGRLSEDGGSSLVETTVEDLLDMVRHLPADASAVQAVAEGLCSLDSGALAALLKELNKAGHARRAQEIFDWLRALEPSHNLSALCTTMTYTTMISQCGTQQALRRALELMAEMRSRGVQCNVHTYSALMNVCIKANELDLALDVYGQMTAEACTPNLVTYNTLIDVYGKTGAWEEAVGVLDLLEAQGIEPEVRTYNTVIIACNQSSRATEALRVYERMLAAGAQPTATTYTALISAYGKAGQLDSALQIFQDMLRRGCERNVITYSSLISACEKAGKWELALQLFQEMHAEGCRPNVVTYNSLIAACAQGAQWQKAQELFDQMQSKGCRPDSVTFGGLIAAYDRAGLWRRALGAFDQMRNLNCRPDTVVYNTIIGALWRTGLLWAQNRATQIFDAACKQGHFRLTVHTLAPGAVGNSSGGGSAGTPTSTSATAAALHRMNSALSADFFCSGDLESSSATAASLSISSVAMDSFGGSLTPPLSPNEYASLSAATCRSPSPGFPLSSPQSAPLSPASSMTLLPGVAVEFGMHAFTVGSAVLSLLRWISELRERLPRDTTRMEGNQTVALVLNKGKPSRVHTYPAIRAALVAMLTSWSSPFILTDVSQGCRIDATAQEVYEWLNTAPAEAALISFLAQSGTGSGGGSRGASPIVSCNARDIFFQEDAVVESRCAEAFAAVSRFEAAYSAAAAVSMEQQQHYNATASGNGSGCVIIIDREETSEKEGGIGGGGDADGNADRDESDAVFALATNRGRWFSATTDLASICGYSDEVVHDATLLLDRAVAASGKRAMGVAPLAAIVASLHIAARQAGEQPPHSTTTDAINAAAGLEAGDSENAANVIRSLLGGDTSSISALRVLKLFLERLGADFSSGSAAGLRPAAGAALDLLPVAVCDAKLRNLPPSTTAAAVLVAGRRLAGRSPFWPSSLAALTGLDDAAGTVLGMAADRAVSLIAHQIQEQN